MKIHNEFQFTSMITLIVLTLFSPSNFSFIHVDCHQTKRLQPHHTRRLQQNNTILQNGQQQQQQQQQQRSLDVLNHLSLIRQLSELERNFVPLCCNDKIQENTCIPWTTKFGNNLIYQDLVIIPCGECIVMDSFQNMTTTHSTTTIEFLKGLDIHGKLLFPEKEDGPHHTLIIRSTMIIIQGQLEMYVTNKKVDGNPSYIFQMIAEKDDNNNNDKRNVDQFFIPIGENAMACAANTPQCMAGQKGIIVAGGQLNVHGIPPNCPTWLHLHSITSSTNNASAIDTLILNKVVFNQWTTGAEILITPHTGKWDEHQVRKVMNVTLHEGELVKLVLNESISKPITLIDTIDFAVEVALLSRNIVFDGGKDDVPLDKIGGHLMIMNSPDIEQILEGVDFQNFGQQGSLGRYPIHFHLCNNATGSVVGKNTIRYSNQRCVVIHGTNNVRIEDNISYETKGHCYLLEDGIETGNIFSHNLGAKIMIPEKLIPDKGFNGKETDDDPSGFWITNPSNSFVGNVVAGSAGSGFWFELLVRGTRAHLYPDLNPKKNDLTLFENNTVHSCVGRAVKTYPTGYVPDNRAKLLGLKVYRNTATGLFLHLTHNIDVENSIFFGNQVGIDIDRADSIQIENTRIIGLDEFSNHNSSIAQTLCKKQLIGVELHSWKDNENNLGVALDTINFSGFTDRPCLGSVPILIDNTIKTGMFDSYTTLKNIVFDSRDTSVDFCPTEQKVLDDVYLTDLDGSLRPSIVESNSGLGVLINRKAKMLTFLGAQNCTLMDRGCYYYCTGTCIRSVRYEIDPAGSQNYVLKVCGVESTNCISVPGYLRDEWVGRSQRLRMYTVHVPAGQYEATFQDADGNEVWPSFVNEIVEDDYCPMVTTNSGDESFNVSITKPKSQILCRNLIRNGNFEESSTEPVHWLFRFGDLFLARGEGIGKSNALSVTKKGTGRLKIIQYLDNRCFELMVGRTYNVTAAIKLTKTTSSNQTANCFPNNPENCPQIGITSEDKVIKKITTMIPEMYQGNQSDVIDGYYILRGQITIDPEMRKEKQMAFYIESNVPATFLFVDNVSMDLVLNYENEFEPTNSGFNASKQLEDKPLTVLPMYETEQESGTHSIYQLDHFGKYIQPLLILLLITCCLV